MFVKTGPSTNRKLRRPCSSSSSTFVPVMSEGIRSGVNWMRLKPRSRIRGQRADHQRLRQPRHALQQAVPAGEDGGEHLLDHLVLPDDDLLQLLLHDPPMLAKLLQNVAKIACWRRQGAILPELNKSPRRHNDHDVPPGFGSPLFHADTH